MQKLPLSLARFSSNHPQAFLNQIRPDFLQTVYTQIEDMDGNYRHTEDTNQSQPFTETRLSW